MTENTFILGTPDENTREVSELHNHMDRYLPDTALETKILNSQVSHTSNEYSPQREISKLAKFHKMVHTTTMSGSISLSPPKKAATNVKIVEKTTPNFKRSNSKQWKQAKPKVYDVNHLDSDGGALQKTDPSFPGSTS